MPSFNFNVPITRDATNWGNVLVDTLKQSFTQLSKQIADNNVSQLTEQIQKLTVTVQEGINGVRETANEALQFL